MAHRRGRRRRGAAAGMETTGGRAQLRAARRGAAVLAPRAVVVAALAHAMRRLGLRASAQLVLKMASALDAILKPRTLEGAAKAAAAGYDIGDPRRPEAIVAAQVRLVLAAGPAAVDAARSLAEHAMAFSKVLAEWAAEADEYGRDGAAEEAVAAKEGKRFVRRQRDQIKFTAMSVDLSLGRYEQSQVKMYILRDSILSPTRVVEYCPFRARLDTDPEEIDSPKAAVYADECEVRLPDGARVEPSGMRFMVRESWVDDAALGYVERLRGLEVSRD